jgi:hypothetical protein
LRYELSTRQLVSIFSNRLYNLKMNTQNPATPAQAATPGSVPAVSNPQPVTTPAPTGNQGDNQEGKITITAKEYRDLQRAKARTLSFDKRKDFLNRKPNPTSTANDDGSNGDPEIVARLAESEQTRHRVERENLQLKVKGQVRELLDREEFKVLPRSTRDLILKNPALLSEADSAEEALLDIEDFVRDQVIALETGSQSKDQRALGGQPSATGHEVPPNVSSASPAPMPAEGLEDTSKLSGPERSQAIIRNQMKRTRGTR